MKATARIERPFKADYFSFAVSWLEEVDKLPDETEKRKAFEAIMLYGLDGIVKTTVCFAEYFDTVIRPDLDRQRRRQEEKQKRKAKRKQADTDVTETNTKALHPEVLKTSKQNKE